LRKIASFDVSSVKISLTNNQKRVVNFEYIVYCILCTYFTYMGSKNPWRIEPKFFRW